MKHKTEKAIKLRPKKLLNMKIFLFGITRDIIGSSALELPQKDSNTLKTVDDLKGYLFRQYPELHHLKTMAVAVNNEYATNQASINETDEIALIPPVSGG